MGKVEINHGGFELGMAHVSLDDTQVDADFEEMSGIGVAVMPSSGLCRVKRIHKFTRDRVFGRSSFFDREYSA